MNGPSERHRRIEDIMKCAQFPKPSEELKNRVIGTAKEAWDQPPQDIPWRIPLRRLVISTAAALTLISAANSFSDMVIARTLSKRSNTVNENPTDINALSDMPDALKYRWVRTGYQPTSTDPQYLIEHVEAVRQMLQEDHPKEPAEPIPPANGRSQKIINPIHMNVWS